MGKELGGEGKWKVKGGGIEGVEEGGQKGRVRQEKGRRGREKTSCD